jgi:hypothetical protein
VKPVPLAEVEQYFSIRALVRALKAAAQAMTASRVAEMRCLKLSASGAWQAWQNRDFAEALKFAIEAKQIADSYPSPGDWARLTRSERRRTSPENLGRLRSASADLVVAVGTQAGAQAMTQPRQ